MDVEDVAAGEREGESGSPETVMVCPGSLNWAIRHKTLKYNNDLFDSLLIMAIILLLYLFLYKQAIPLSGFVESDEPYSVPISEGRIGRNLSLIGSPTRLSGLGQVHKPIHKVTQSR